MAFQIMSIALVGVLHVVAAILYSGVRRAKPTGRSVLGRVSRADGWG
jgi:hypothetical protein